MRKIFFMIAVLMLSVASTAQENGCYIEVNGTAEVEIVPNDIHYVIEIKEYFEEEFMHGSKPEDYRTKVPLDVIEKNLRMALLASGIASGNIRTQEVGNMWRESGKDFLVSKRFDITLDDFGKIDKILKNIDTRGISGMFIGELNNDNIAGYQRKGRIDALKAAREKAEYLAEAAGRKLGKVLRIVENGSNDTSLRQAQAASNVFMSDTASFDKFRTIKKRYTMFVRYELAD